MAAPFFIKAFGVFSHIKARQRFPPAAIFITIDKRYTDGIIIIP